MFCVRTGYLSKTIDEEVIGEMITAGKKSNVYTPSSISVMQSISIFLPFHAATGHANIYNIITYLIIIL